MNKWPEGHGRIRRWSPAEPFQCGGLWYRVTQGAKGKQDLRLEQHDGRRWVPVYMEQAFMMSDFFHENEQWLEQERPHWRKPGGSYFLEQLREAVAGGWQGPADRIKRQRGSR
jgi:hypothetical protein